MDSSKQSLVDDDDATGTDDGAAQASRGDGGFYENAIPWHSLHERERARVIRLISQERIVRDKLREFWGVLDLVKDERGRINQAGYTELNIRFQQALHPPHTVEEALAGAREDWTRDCDGDPTGIDFDRFVGSVIELVEMLDLISERRDGGRWFVPVASICRIPSLRSAEDHKQATGKVGNEQKALDDEYRRLKALQDAAAEEERRRRQEEEAASSLTNGPPPPQEMLAIAAQEERRRWEARERREREETEERRVKAEIDRQRKQGLGERRRVAEDKWLCQREGEELVRSAGERERRKEEATRAAIEEARARRRKQGRRASAQEAETMGLRAALESQLGNAERGLPKGLQYGDTKLRTAALGEDQLGEVVQGSVGFGGSRLKKGQPRSGRRASLPNELSSPDAIDIGMESPTRPLARPPAALPPHTIPKATKPRAGRRSSLPPNLGPTADGPGPRGPAREVGRRSRAGSSLELRSLPPELVSPPGPPSSLYNLNPHAVIPAIGTASPEDELRREAEASGEKGDASTEVMGGANSIIERIRRKGGARRHSVV